MTFQDKALPALSVALDPDAVLESIRRALRASGSDIDATGAKILDVHYRPRMQARILYRLKMRPSGGRSFEQLVWAALRSEAAPEPAPLQPLLDRYGARRGPALPEPVLRLHGEEILLHAYPVDGVLPGLFDALDPKVVRRELRRTWVEKHVKLRSVAVRTLAYTPEMRATFAYDVLSESRETGVPELRRLVAKMNAHRPAARLFAGAWALWRAVGHRLPLAPPAGYVPGLNVTLQEQLQGSRLSDLAHLGTFEALARRAARAIATVHRLDLPLRSWRTPDKEAQRLQRWRRLLCALCPEDADRIERLTGRMVAGIEKLARVAGPVHGDFHPANMLVDRGRVVLLDLDDLAYGDPLLDVGRFLASLRVSAFRVHGSASGLQGAAEAFLAEYLVQAPDDERRARLFEAVALLLAAGGPFRLQREGWRDAARLLVDEAERALAQAEKGAALALAGTPPQPAAAKPRLEPAAAKPHSEPAAARPHPEPARTSAGAPAPMGDRVDRASGRVVADALLWAGDSQYMRTVLEPHIGEIYGAELSRCRVTSRPNVPGAGAEVGRFRYDLRGWRGEEPWAGSLQGIVWRGRRGRAAHRRLTKMHAELAGRPGAPLLPRPIVYLKAISTSVWEMPPGERLDALLDSPAALQAASQVARALAVLHRTPVHFRRSRCWETELRSLRSGVDSLAASRPGLVSRAEGLARELARRTDEVGQELRPSLCRLDPRHVRVDGDRVAFERVERIALSLPYMDVADLLAHLTLAGIDAGSEEHAAAVADRFWDDYQTVNAIPGDGIAPVRAAALVRLACRQPNGEAGAAVAARLLDVAEARLEAPNRTEAREAHESEATG